MGNQREKGEKMKIEQNIIGEMGPKSASIRETRLSYRRSLGGGGAGRRKEEK
jgi:hypothetical protein